MKPPTTSPESEQSTSSGGAQTSAKTIYQKRKHYGKTVAALGELSQYKVEHLCTFPVERKEAMLTVEDSVRKLQLLEARGKVWSQEILLNVDDKTIKLIDSDSKEVLENFPLSSLAHVQPVLNSCNFNSICGLVIKDSDQHTADIYLFQCSVVPADIICADIESAFQDIKTKKGPKSRPETLRRHRDTIEAKSRPPSTPPLNVKDRVAEWTNAIEAHNDQQPPSPRSSINGQQETNPEILAFKIHRDVQILNHTLDDIELFVSLIQKSAEASKQLTVRKIKRKASKRSKGRSPGNGIMELRARLPSKEQFIDCFQKFRFCFNLLAKLRMHIKEPNSNELIHYLFQPLGMIINTSSGLELPCQVECPLLYNETIDFMRECLNPMEEHLWLSLGHFWTKPREFFPKDMSFPPFLPRFKSGWIPPRLPSMQNEDKELAATIQVQADHVQRTEEAWKAGGSNIEDALKPLSPVTPTEPTSSASKQNANRGNDTSNAFKVHVQNHVARNQAAHGASPSRKLCRAMQEYSARNEHELSVKRDDLLDVIDDSKPEWYRVQNKEGGDGYVPKTHLLLISSATKSPGATSSDSPPNFSPPAPAASASKVPVPPPPPPAPPVNNTPMPNKLRPVSVPISTAVTSAGLNGVVLKKPSTNENRPKPFRVDPDALQAELQQRIASKKERNFVIPKKSASLTAVTVNKLSSPSEVKRWLQSLGFSITTVESLRALDGAQIFSLDRDELKQIAENEGPRVYSQLMIQRSVDGFSSTRQNSELGKIMMQRRQEIPGDKE